jgi:hypothetical protein
MPDKRHESCFPLPDETGKKPKAMKMIVRLCFVE